MTEFLAFIAGFVAGVWPVVLLRTHRPKPVAMQANGTFTPPVKKRSNPFGSRAKRNIPFGL